MNEACRLLCVTTSRTVDSAWFCAPVSASTYARSASCSVHVRQGSAEWLGGSSAARWEQGQLL